MQALFIRIRSMPKIMRRFILFICGLMAFFGFLVCARQCTTADEFAKWFIFWMILALALGTAVFAGYGLLSVALSRRAEQDLALEYQKSGWSTALADSAKKAFFFCTPHERVLMLLLRVMAEDYEGAGIAELSIPQDALEPRDLAAFRTCQLRRLLMTGQSRKAHSAFAAHVQMQDDAYQFQPCFEAAFKPLAEDALVYYEMAAAVCEREGNHGRAEQYAVLAGLRISGYPEVQRAYLTEQIALSRQYARAKTAADVQDAQNTEKAVCQRITEDKALGSAVRQSLLRAFSQCRIFGSWTQETVKASRFERKLPPAEPDSAG